MEEFLDLPEVLETDEDQNHSGLAGPKKVLWFVCKSGFSTKYMVDRFLWYYNDFVVKRDYRQTTAPI